MAIVIPYAKQTWADGSGGGTPKSAARLTVIEEGIDAAHFMPAVRVYHNAAQTITTGTTTALAFNSERYDQVANVASTHHDTATNNSRLTCRYAGVYNIIGHCSASAATTWIIIIRLNGATQIARQAVNNDYSEMHVSTHYALAVNDYVELCVFQSSGSNKDISSSGNFSPEFMMVRVA